LNGKQYTRLNLSASATGTDKDLVNNIVNFLQDFLSGYSTLIEVLNSNCPREGIAPVGRWVDDEGHGLISSNRATWSP